jgi:uncharacterized protein (TIGR03118 family)
LGLLRGFCGPVPRGGQRLRQSHSVQCPGRKEQGGHRHPAAHGRPIRDHIPPNGVVSNTTSGFVITFKGRSAPATLLFSTEDGTIAGWNPSLSETRAVIAADQSGNGAVYKLLAMGTNAQGTFLYATDFHNGKIDVFDSNFHLVNFSPSAFVDPTTGSDAIPSDFAPFGIKNFNGTLFVTYAKQDAARHDDVPGVGNGFIDEFDSSGNFIGRFASRGLLNSPIGATTAPAGFGWFGGDVLIGNFGDSHVNVFTPTGQFLGQLTDPNGNPLVLNGGFKETDTWGIGFGNGAGGAGANTLFFATGINQENDGLFGVVNVDPPGTGRRHAHRHAGRDQKSLVFVPRAHEAAANGGPDVLTGNILSRDRA